MWLSSGSTPGAYAHCNTQCITLVTNVEPHSKQFLLEDEKSNILKQDGRHMTAARNLPEVGGSSNQCQVF